MKKNILAAVFVLPLLVSVAAGVQLVSVGKANPFWWIELVLPDEYAKTPVMSIFSPTNNTVINRDNIVLSFKVDLGESETDLEEFVRYETDWQHDNLDNFLLLKSSSFSHEVNLIGIPEGNHIIAFEAIESGTYKSRSFTLDSYKTIYFTIKISSETKIPEFPSWAILPLFLTNSDSCNLQKENAQNIEKPLILGDNRGTLLKTIFFQKNRSCPKKLSSATVIIDGLVKRVCLRMF